MSNLHTYALEYARDGFGVIPLHYMKDTLAGMRCSCYQGADCRSPAKHPRFQKWRHTATDEPFYIDRWWKAYPLSNIGLLMGGRNRVIALDFDGEQGAEARLELEKEYEPLPTTRVQESGRVDGGEHWLYRVPVNEEILRIRNRVGIAPGIDIRSEGGYIVAAPSKHKSGSIYKWRDPAMPIAEIPNWLFHLATQSSGPARSTSAGDRPDPEELPPTEKRRFYATQYLSKMSPAIQGQNGSGACLKAAIALIRGFCLDPNDAFNLLWTDYNPRCIPPWSEGELMHKIEAAEHGVDVPWKYLLPKTTKRANAMVDQLYAQSQEAHPVVSVSGQVSQERWNPKIPGLFDHIGAGKLGDAPATLYDTPEAWGGDADE